MATFAPPSARRTAAARPMPREPPVTSATLFSKSLCMPPAHSRNGAACALAASGLVRSAAFSTRGATRSGSPVSPPRCWCFSFTIGWRWRGGGLWGTTTARASYRWRAGEWPFWQRGMFIGYPLLGDIQFQIFNPLTWLTMPLAPARGVTVQSLLELCLCSAGMAYWMKQRGVRAVEGVFAGVAFALCLKQTVHLHHWTFAASTCAWPWMMAGLDGLARTGRARFVALTALATCGTWVGSSPQMAWFGSALAFLYALALAPELFKRGRPLGVAALAAVPLGIALAAPLLLPVAELNAVGPGGG